MLLRKQRLLPKKAIGTLRSMKVLVADKLEPSALAGIAVLGVELLDQPLLTAADLPQALTESGADLLIVRSTKVTAEALEASRLGAVIRAGAGYDTIDVDAASRCGILVANTPGRNAQAVAELAFGLILACDRRIPDGVIALRAGQWDKRSFSQARGISGRTLGIVGMGKIGQEMAVRAKAFGMNVFALSRWLTPEVAAALGIGRANDLSELAQLSDVITVHVALNDETRASLGRDFFAALPEGAIFVNTSRAEVVVQDDLLEAVRTRGLHAGLDVFEGEPSSPEGVYDGALRTAEGVYATHHIGASTEQAQESVAAEVVRMTKEYVLTGRVPNVVNVRSAQEGGEVATHLLVVRHLDKVGVLAHVLGVLKDEGVNVQEMENIVLGGAKAAIAQIAVDGELNAAALLRVKKHESIFDAVVMPLAR